MDFQLTEEQKAVRDAISKFAAEKVAPGALDRDRTGEFPWEVLRGLAEQGYLGMTLPPEYGGAGADWVSYAICVEEISRACASCGVIYEVHNSLHADAIYHHGTEEQRRRFLPDLISGKKLGAFALTEPGAGSDAGGLKSTAELKGDRYILNGRKCFITSGGKADEYIVFALTDKSKGTKGISAFVVDKSFPGISFGEPEDKLGIRASCTADVILEDCPVPVENRLGNEGDGLKIALSTLDGGRVGIACQAVGIAQAAFDAALAYSKERQQFGRPISEFQAIQWMLADMATDIEAARLLAYRAAYLRGTGQRASKEIAMAKLFASRAAVKHTANAIQIHGGYGYMRDYKVERLFRDAKITEIYEGTSEVMRMVIAGALLK
ncbi:MAG: acyl-CoA dehydrogenase family protein [Acetobacteraceae bacterium]|nr:acyl-CoA dehydrogenase family protein [Acetobacteraceae bacterium]